MVNIKLIKMINKNTGLPYLQIFQNHTIYQFADETGMDYEKLIKYLKEFNIIGDDHYPYEEFEDWFEVRDISQFGIYLLAITSYGEIEIIKFCRRLKKDHGINIFKKQ